MHYRQGAGLDWITTQVEACLGYDRGSSASPMLFCTRQYRRLISDPRQLTVLSSLCCPKVLKLPETRAEHPILMRLRCGDVPVRLRGSFDAGRRGDKVLDSCWVCQGYGMVVQLGFPIKTTHLPKCKTDDRQRYTVLLSPPMTAGISDRRIG